MVRFRICILRHSKSCSNLLLERGQNGQNVRDPGLTSLGRTAAEKYSPVLQSILRANGFDLENTVVGASPLLRAQETARTLFPNTIIHQFDQLSEHGHIPENIPRCRTISDKGWNVFLKWLVKTYSAQSSVSIVAVGHRTFFRKEVLSPLGKDIPLSNMDGAIVEYDSDTGKTKFIKYILYGKKIETHGDRCIISTPQKIKSHGYSSMKSRSRNTRTARKSRKAGKSSQRGGGLPYLYNQMSTMSDTPTGVGLGATSSAWIRDPISQSGGKRQNKTCKCQGGGFSPSAMGHFVANGLSLLPAAGFMYYRSTNKKTRKTRRK